MDLEVTHLFENSHDAWYLGGVVNDHDLGELVCGALVEVESLIQETSRNSNSVISTPCAPPMLLPWVVLGHGEMSQRGS